MKKIFTILLTILIASFLSSCVSYSVSQRSLHHKDIMSEDMYGPSCPSPIYIATMGASAYDGNPDSIIYEKKITLFSLLNIAQEKYGKDVTIQNVRWDKRNRKKVSVIFDVIKCK